MDMIILSDKEGLCPFSADGLAYHTRVPEKLVRRALDLLSSPDPDSATATHDGRRIIQATNGQRGWIVVNKKAYWSQYITTEQREKDAERKREERERDREASEPISVDSSEPPPDSGVICFKTSTKDTWVRREAIRKWSARYPSVDVLAELEDARDWLDLNVEKRQPPSGLHAFLGRWISRSKKSGRFHKRDESDVDVDFSPTKEDMDPHNPEKDGIIHIDGKRTYSSTVGGFVPNDEYVPKEEVAREA